MSREADLPWKEIYEYLLETEYHDDLDGFFRQAMLGMASLIPFDAACVIQGNPEATRLGTMDTIGIEPGMKDAYLRYFHQFDCFKPRIVSAERTAVIAWREFRHTEFLMDFLRPQRIRHSVGIILRDRTHRRIAAVVLHRTTQKGFPERELVISAALQPHLSYLFALFNRTAAPAQEAYFPAELSRHCRLLSKREAEVAALLCQRMTASEIAARLQIARRTVEFHTANIYDKLRVGNRRELLLQLLGGE